MRERHDDLTAALEERLRGLPRAEAPECLALSVMSRMADRPVPWWRRMARSFAAPRAVTLSPLRAALWAACLLAVFGLGYLTGGGPEGQAPVGSTLADVQVSDGAEASYFMGRSLLAAMRPAEALPHLERAARLNPDSAEISFWTGVAHWALHEPEQEERNYLRAVSLDPGHVQSRLYLGHNYLERGLFEEALAQYEAVLAAEPGAEQALFNRGLALRGLNRPRAEAAAWKRLLHVAPGGTAAIRAADYLNAMGDFSYRVHHIGRRGMVLPRFAFDGARPTAADEAALRRVGRAASVMPGLTLHVVVYVDGDVAAAKARALALRDRLLTLFPDLDANRVKPSWFGVPERGDAGDAAFSLNESVRFIGLVPDGRNKGGSRT